MTIFRCCLRMFSLRPRVPTASTVYGETPTVASTAPRVVATTLWPFSAASLWLSAGDASSLTSPFHTCGTSLLVWGPSWSTVAALRSSSARACSAVWVPSARRLGSSSATSSSRTLNAQNMICMQRIQIDTRIGVGVLEWAEKQRVTEDFLKIVSELNSVEKERRDSIF